MSNEHVTIDLRKIEPKAYHVRLRFRELWQAWRHGINLPANRVSPLISFSVDTTGVEFIGPAGCGGEGGYVGQWTVPEGVTSVDIEVIGGTEHDRPHELD